MPYIDGLKLSSIIRKDNYIVSIIITTSYTHTDDLLKVVELCLAEYIVKPYNLEQLSQA